MNLKGIFASLLLLALLLPMAFAEDTNVAEAVPVALDDTVLPEELAEPSVDPVGLEITELDVELIEENIGDELIEDDGGVGPDNLFYGLDLLLDDLSLMFTTNPAQKAKLSMKIANERLMEAKNMTKLGKTEHTMIALQEYEEQVELAEDAVEEIPTNGDPVTARETLRETLELQSQLEDQELKASIILDEIDFLLENVDPAMIKVENKNMVKIEIEGTVIKIKDKLNKFQVQVKTKKENSKTALRAEEELTEEEVEDLEDEAEEETGVAEERKQRKEVKVNRTKNVLREGYLEAVEEAPELAEEFADELLLAEDTLDGLDSEDLETEEEDEVIENFANFGKEISDLAKKVKTGEATRTELVAAANQIHVRVLEKVQEKVSEQARERIAAVIKKSEERIEEKIREREEKKVKSPKDSETDDEEPESPEASEDAESDETKGKPLAAEKPAKEKKDTPKK